MYTDLCHQPRYWQLSASSFVPRMRTWFASRPNPLQVPPEAQLVLTSLLSPSLIPHSGFTGHTKTRSCTAAHHSAKVSPSVCLSQIGLTYCPPSPSSVTAWQQQNRQSCLLRQPACSSIPPAARSPMQRHGKGGRLCNSASAVFHTYTHPLSIGAAALFHTWGLALSISAITLFHSFGCVDGFAGSISSRILSCC